jgi:hypothetical protein
MLAEYPGIGAESEALQQPLPVPDVDPAAELEALLLEQRHLLHSKLLVQRHARRIRQRDAAHSGVNTSLFQPGEQDVVQQRA